MTAALVIMGVVDGVHAFAPFGLVWSWLRHGATLAGGLVFALVWLPVPAGWLRRQSWLVGGAALMALGVCSAIWSNRASLPTAWIDGGYSTLVILANGAGGLGFLAAAAFFIRRHLCLERTEDLVFASHTLLFGTAAVLFGFSHVWAADWWTWHAFRLTAYVIVLGAAYEIVVAAYQQIASHARVLEDAVRERTADLHQERERLRVTLSSIGDGVIAADREGLVSFINPVAQALTGWDERDALGQPIGALFRVIDEQTREPAADIAADVLRNGRAATLANHTALVARDGREIPIEDSAAPIRGGDGAVSGVVLVFHDVTGRRRAQQALAASEEQFRNFFDHAPMGKVITAPDGRLIRVNPAFAEMLGYTIDELAAVSFASITHPEDLGESRECVRALLAGERDIWRLEKRYIAKDGHLVWTRVVTRLQRDGDGNPLYFLTHAQDITANRHADEAIRAAELTARRRAEELECVMDMAPIAICVAHDPLCHHITGNRTANALWEAEASQNVSAGPAEGEHDTTRRFFQNGRELLPEELPMQQASALGIDVRNSELEVVSPSGRPFTMLGSASPLRDDEGRVRGCVGAFVDITERKRSEAEVSRLNAELELRVEERTAELTATNQELESFTYAVSHDLRAPIRAMRGFSAAIAEDCGETLPEQARGYLEQIAIAGRNMGELVDGLLALSRSTRGELSRDRVDLAAIAGTIRLQLEKAEPGRWVAWDIEPGLVARGDSRMLEIVMTNLLENAWKYTSRTESATIRVRGGSGNGESRFRIEDNGAGFDMKHADRLFQPFQRLHRQDELPGIGIGLATARRILHRHGGTIDATAAVGRGAVFTFTLPSPEAQSEKQS